MAGIKETKEALVGVNELSVFLISKFKDGFQIGDFVSVFEKLTQDAEFKAKMEAAYTGIGMVPSEISDLDATEGIELAITQISYVSKFIDALKG